MTETVIVAILTFASGLTGALIGGFIAYKVAKFSSRQSYQQLLHSEKLQIYAELLETYNLFLAYLTNMVVSNETSFVEEECTLYTRFQSAYSKAILISSEDTRKKLTSFVLLVNEYGKTRIEPEKLTISFNIAVQSLKKELSFKQ